MNGMQEETNRWSGERRVAECVVIGNGIAGMTAAVEARRLAPDLPITLITQQNHPTINTPALKQFMVKAVDREHLMAFPLGTERDAHLAMIHGEVVQLDATSKCLHFSTGESLGYESLLLATGSKAQRLSSNLPGHDLDGVITLHRLRDYLDLERRLKTGEVQNVVVIGGGVHASETVTGLLRQKVQVHWLVRGDTFYSRMLDARASSLALDTFRQEGAQVSLGTEVIGIVGKVGSVAGVVTTQHAFLPCELILVCIGSVPAMQLAEQCDLPLNQTPGPLQDESGALMLPRAGHKHRSDKRVQGIAVDSRLRTCVPGIYAAGDVAAIPNALTGTQEIRAQWASAVEQGKVAGAMLAGRSEHATASFGVPWHMTAIGGLFLLTIGSPLHTQGAEALVNLSDGDYRRVTLTRDRLVGYLSLSREQPDGLGIKRLIEEGAGITEVEQRLLDGTFDARSYYTQRNIAQVTDQRDDRQSETGRAESGVPQGRGIVSSQPARRGQKAPATHETWPQVVEEVNACIGCNECLIACPALAEPLGIDLLNRETLFGPVSGSVIRFARACYQCGACVGPCPVGLHRDSMMMMLKVALLRGEAVERHGAVLSAK